MVVRELTPSHLEEACALFAASYLTWNLKQMRNWLICCEIRIIMPGWSGAVMKQSGT